MLIVQYRTQDCIHVNRYPVWALALTHRIELDGEATMGLVPIIVPVVSYIGLVS